MDRFLGGITPADRELLRLTLLRANSHEAHITVDPKDRAMCERHGAGYRFHYSEIAGDEEMGPGVRGYLTRSDKNVVRLGVDLLDLCLRLESVGVRWQRRKVEAILMDARPK